jgi:glycosyltransferase involved in cell wall biosynthesis
VLYQTNILPKQQIFKYTKQKNQGILMNNSRLTIITPVLNSIQFIEKCILNVIEQNCSDQLEHLIIDAGSTDGTLEVIKSYAEKFAHIRYISEPDNGQSDAMNKGIKLANNSIISFLNADDVYYPFTLRRVIHLFKSKPGLEFISGNCKVVSQDGDLIYLNRPKRIKAYHLFSYTEAFPVNPVAYFYKKEIHNKTGLYNTDDHHTMDYDFILKASLVTNIIYFNEDWGYAMYHDGSKTQQDLANNQMFEKKKKTFETNYANAPANVKIKAAIYKALKKLKIK